MNYSNHTSTIAELAESEGVFTTAQAARLGIPRDALHDAVESQRLERIVRGAYRLVGSGSTFEDELIAIWKLTNPSRFTHERLQTSGWDGIVVGGTTAASLLDIGDFYLSPYRLYAPKRINSRNPSASFAVRAVSQEDVTFSNGVPVTRPERTIYDLVIDHVDYSLVRDALRDAVYKDRGFDFGKLEELLVSKFGKGRASTILNELFVQDCQENEMGL